MVTVSHKVLVATKDLNFARPAISPTRKAINPLIFFFSIKFLFGTGLSVRYSNKQQR